MIVEKQNIGFDDLSAKLDYMNHQYQETTAQWIDTVEKYGKSNWQAQLLRLKCWHQYLGIQQEIIEEFVDNEELRSQCILYIHRLSSTYDLKKSKSLLDEFVEIIQKPKNWFTIQLFMRRNPVV